MHTRKMATIGMVVAALTLLLATSSTLAGPSVQESGPGALAPVGTAFTYQGRLTDGGSPASGSYDFRFILYDSAVGGSQVGGIVTLDNQAVTEGLFTVLLDFGSVFTGSARCLEVAVRPGASTGDYTVLSPRQALTPAPYALNADLLDGQHASAFASAAHNHDAAYWKLAGNSGTSPGSHFLGTADNQALELRVNSARVLRLEPHATSPNVIGGYSGNSVTSGAYGATIAGGGENGRTNRVTDDYGAVGGGYNNQASGYAATVSGGYGNTGSGFYATVSGGERNTASPTYATVGGGALNTASGGAATVGGGVENTASGDYATVGGGEDNIASGAGATVGGGGYDGIDTDGNEASGDAATIGGGYGNTASGYYTTVGGGWSNQATADYATIAGGGRSDPADPATANRVTDNYGTVGGGGNNLAGDADADPTDMIYATVGGGYGNTARYGYTTVGGGYENMAHGDGATVSGGYDNDAGGYYATVGGGYDNAASAEGATIGGGGDNDASQRYATVGGGLGNQATAGYATIAGGGRSDPANAATANRVTDDYGTVGGGGNNLAGDADADPTDTIYATVAGGAYNTASGEGAFVGGGTHNSASGRRATVSGGAYNIASDDTATVGGGYSNNATGNDGATVGGGWYNIASDRWATVSGGAYNIASVRGATVPGGFDASASHWCEMAYASGSFASPGDAQTSVYVLRNTTTNATPTELFLDGDDIRLTIVPTATVVFDVLVVARSAGDNSAGYIMRGIIENDDGVTSLIGVPSVVAMGEDRAAWSVAVTADDAHDALVISVTGEAGYTIRWVATVRTVEVGH